MWFLKNALFGSWSRFYNVNRDHDPQKLQAFYHFLQKPRLWFELPIQNQHHDPHFLHTFGYSKVCSGSRTEISTRNLDHDPGYHLAFYPIRDQDPRLRSQPLFINTPLIFFQPFSHSPKLFLLFPHFIISHTHILNSNPQPKIIKFLPLNLFLNLT